MSHIKVSRTASTRTNRSGKRQEWPIVVYLWAFGLAIFGYAAARIGLSGLPHPYHWITGLIGAAVGMLVGWVWYRWRGDVL